MKDNRVTEIMAGLVSNPEFIRIVVGRYGRHDSLSMRELATAIKALEEELTDCLGASHEQDQ